MQRLQEGYPSMVQELHKDLARKWRVHGAKVEQIWRSLDQAQREKAVRDGALNREVLSHSADGSMGAVYKFMPEWNIRDLTRPGSDYLLDILKHRATKSLCEQYAEGVYGGSGDAAFIALSMQVNNLRPVQMSENCFTVFKDEETFGNSFRIKAAETYRQTLSDLSGLSVAVNAGVLVPQFAGDLILTRMLYLLQVLNIVIQDILEAGSSASESAKAPSKKPEEAARAALSTLSITPRRAKPSMQDVINSALDQKICLEEYLKLCRTEPAFLADIVNHWFFTGPELVQDEKGRMMPLVTDKYVSIAVFEVMHNAVTAAAIWDYIYRLLQIVENHSKDQVFKRIILQELSNVCHFEYERIQKLFKRYVQIYSGAKHFKRISGVYDDGVARVTMKTKPETLTLQNPQLHYLLRLCQPNTNVTRAVTWIRKLDDLHNSHPDTRVTMVGMEFDTFGDLAVTAGFVQSLSQAVSLPPAALKKGQMYTSRLKELIAELDPLKMDVDLADFAVPIDNLMEPGMADGALNTLDQFIVERTGTEIGFLYQDLNESCLSDIQTYYRQAKAKAEQNSKDGELEPSWTSLGSEAPSHAAQVQQRKEKSKTRPPHSSVYNISPKKVNVDNEANNKTNTNDPSPTFKVKQQTAAIFSFLFSKGSLRGSVSWDAFTAAMTDLNFSVVPKDGSVVTFYPPEDLKVHKSFTVHRPHQSRIEGHKLTRFAMQLKRLYGWSDQSFVTA